MKKAWMRYSFLITLLFLPLLTQANNFSDTTCPAYVRIPPVIALSDADAKDIDWVIQSLADSIPMQLKPTNVRIITPEVLNYALKKITPAQSASGEDNSRYKDMTTRSDFIVLIRWQKILNIKHVLTLRLQSHDGDVLGVRSLDVNYLKNQTDEINSFVHDAGEYFGTLLINQFYCIRITPKDVSASPGNVYPLDVQVENLKGDPVSGESVDFNVSNINAGTISPSHATLSEGKTKTTYEQKKLLDNQVEASIKPREVSAAKSSVIAKIHLSK